MVKIIAVDGDIPAYMASTISEDKFQWPGCEASSITDEDKATEYIDNFVTELYKKFGEDIKIIFTLSDDENFRKQLLPTYKGNRKDIKKPELLKFCKDYIMDNYNCYVFPRLEGDDVLGIIATSPKVKGEVIIATLDKDLKQIGVPIWDFKNKKMVQPEPFFFWTQVLSGDRVDGFNGLPRVGEKTARKILEGISEEDYWKVIIEAYESKGMSEEDALITARMAYILRDKDYNRKTGKVKLWKPA